MSTDSKPSSYEYYLGASIATGLVTPDGHFLQMRRGPATPDAVPDFAGAEPTLAALVRGKTQYRNDGDGWYETDQLPGIGLDPATIARLPGLLRRASAAADAPRVDVAGLALPTVTAQGAIADAPGLMAIDAAPFTELVAPLTFSFDEQGRLVRLEARMRNTNLELFDLIVVTEITFSYDAPGALPEPLP